jgi:CubicO group peptidase (beta-lactamase class C family)
MASLYAWTAGAGFRHAGRDVCGSTFQAHQAHSLLIVRNGYLVVEAYASPYSPDIRHTVQSNTKSVIGTLIGIAIDQGQIKSVSQKLVDFFPELTIKRDDEKDAITLEDLLTMTPGLDCKDGTTAGDGMYQTQNWVQYLLDLPMTAEPGKTWSYCSGASHLLSAVLQQATGMDARAYANRYLFKPLGIPEVGELDWGTDPQSVSNGVDSLYLTPRELAKYGYLYLNKGNWDGQQIISENWVEESIQEHAFIDEDQYVGGIDRRFGYMFFLFPDLKYYGYLGRGGQELFVLPESNLVVVFTASMKMGDEEKLLKLVNDYIVPSVLSDPPITGSIQADAGLSNFRQINTGSEQPPAPLPQVALDISGKTFTLDQNPLGWESMTFLFEPGSDEAILKMAGAPDLNIGLDNTYHITEIPESRPVGLLGSWKTSSVFNINYLVLGDFVEVVAEIRFETDHILVSITDLNFGGSSVLIRGDL